MSFWKIAKESLKSISDERLVLTKALFGPLLLIVLLSYFDSLDLPIYLQVLSFLANAIVQTTIAVTVHRLILLGPEEIAPWGFTIWSTREVTFLSYFLLLYILVLAPSLVFSGVFYLVLQFSELAAGYLVDASQIFYLLSIIFCIWLTSRLSLVFPGIAIGKGVSFKLSWEVTRSHTLLMILVLVAAPIVASPFAIFLELFGLGYVTAVLGALTIVVGIALLSKTYLYLTEAFYEPA